LPFAHLPELQIYVKATESGVDEVCATGLLAACASVDLMYDGGAPTSRFGTGPAHTVAMRLFDLAPGNDATARRAPGTYEYARPTGAASRVLWDHSSELISLLAASGTATICVEGAAEGKALRSRLYKLARLDAVAAAPDVYEFQGDANPLGLDRYG
jgi:hypothetical protein